jgi:class 3 adenylate cyclase/tetratricopeptide (TPR) repeat protein
MTCVSCGFSNPSGHRFCGGCGSKLDEASPAVLAERRFISVLFVDLVGFTPFSEGRDSEDVRAMLARYFELARTAIAGHGGVVDKLMGDGVMAVWGARTVREDDAEQAVLAALEILEGVAAIGEGIGARAGVNSGEAAVDMSGQDAGMVIGDLVNTAARLESAALPGTVLVGAGTFRAAGSRIEFDDAGAQQLKGKGAPTPTWVARGPRRGDASGVLSPFLGRDAELRQLVQAAASPGPGARMVSVVGAAGVGKTRLAEELRREMRSSATVVYGRSQAGAFGTTLGAFAEMVRTLADVEESADDASTGAQVDRFLAETVENPVERAWIEPALLRLLGVDTDEVAGTELFWRWRLLLERLAQRRPLVLVFDDVQSADATSLDFIDHLLAWVRDERIVVVTLARRELLLRRPNWSASASTTYVELWPLPNNVVADILGALVPDLPVDVSSGVVRRCEGIPLYALEIVRMLAVEGQIIRSGAGYELSGDDVGTIHIPESLTALVASRLDTLPPAVRTTALEASVLGDRFSAGTLAAMCGAELRALLRALDSLVDAAVLVEDTTTDDDHTYQFTQGLVREIAYNTLSRLDRRRLHSSVARHLESSDDDDHAGVVAAHDLAAYKCAPSAPDADMFAARAVGSIRSAVDKAWLLGAFGQVVALAADALQLSVSAGERGFFQERGAEAAIELGNYANVLEGLEEALDFHDRAGDADAAARVAYVIGDALFRLARSDAARAVLERAIEQYTGRVDAVRLGMLQVQLARALDFDGKSEEGFLLAERVVSVANDHGAIALKADALVAQGTCCLRPGRIEHGIDALTEGIGLAEQSGRLGTLLRGKSNLAWILMEHDPRRAHAFIVDGISFARRIGATGTERWMLGIRVELAQCLGDWDDLDHALDMVALDGWEGSDRGAMLSLSIVIAASRGLDVSVLREQLSALEPHVAVDEFASWLGPAGVAIATADGRLGDAEAAAWSCADADLGRLPTAWLSAARCSLWAGHPQQAEQALRQLDETTHATHLFLLVRDALAGSVDFALGHAGQQVSAVLEHRQTLLDLGLRWPAALVAIDAAIAFGTTHPEVSTELTHARSFFADASCLPYVTMIDGLTAGEADRSPKAVLPTA